MVFDFRLIAGVLLGLGLGGNDAANVFGTGVATGVVKYRLATVLTALFVVVGALLEGPSCMDTVKNVSQMNFNLAFIASLAAAISVLVFTKIGLPISTSQAIMGAIIGTGLAVGNPVSWGTFFGKVVPAWVFTPIGAMIIGFVLYRVLGHLVEKWARGAKLFDSLVKAGIIISGIYGAYSLGANNVANTTGVFYGAGVLTAFQASLIGGLSIAFGVLTFSENVMYTVGKKIAALGPFSAFIAVLSEALTVHFYTKVGVPVSTSQAIVGAVVGVGLVRGVKAVNEKILLSIALGWVSTPLSAGILAFVMTKIYTLLF